MHILSRNFQAVFESQVAPSLATAPQILSDSPVESRSASPIDAQFRMPLYERVGLAVLDGVVMAVSVGGLVFTLFIAYSVLK